MTNTAEMEPFTDLCKFALLFGGAIGLALYLQMLRNRFYWVVTETLIGVVTLLTLPFSSAMIKNYQSTGTDSLVEHLFKLTVFATVCQAAVVFLTRNSKDPTVAIGISIGNILSFLKKDIAFIALLIIGDLFQISKVTTREGSLTIGDPVSFHLSVDGLLKFVMASLMFGFPDMFLYMINPKISPNEGHVILTKSIGCIAFGLAVLSFAALCFKRNADGVAVLKAKLLMYLPSLLFGTILSVTDSQYQGPGHIVLVLGSMAVLAVNAAYAIWHDKKEKDC